MKKNIISIAFFIVFVFGLSIFNAFKEPSGFSENENRTLQQMPKFSFETLFNGKFTADFEKFITDQFIFRDEFIQIKTETEVAIGKKENKGVYIGKDGYLLQMIKNPDEKRIAQNIEYLKTFAEKSENTKFMIVPNATHILTNKLPNFVTPYDQGKLIENIKNAVGTENFIDVSEVLGEHKEEYIFYKTDHHYTSLGAFYCANEYRKNMGLSEISMDSFRINEVSNSFFGTLYSQAPLLNITPDTITQFEDDKKYKLVYNMGEYEKDSFYQESFLDTKDKYAYFLGGNNAIVEISGENKNGKKLLVIKDSYANSFLPFIADEFEEIHVLDLRFLNMKLGEYKEKHGITDTLVMYNTQGFTTDMNMYKIIA